MISSIDRQTLPTEPRHCDSNDAERLSIHGGSLRITVSKKQGRSDRLASLKQEEAALGMGDISYYLSFSERVGQLREHLAKFLR